MKAPDNLFKQSTCQAGFTLLELVIFIISAVILVLILAFFFSQY